MRRWLPTLITITLVSVAFWAAMSITQVKLPDEPVDTYSARQGDTLWAIAVCLDYQGDPRDAVQWMADRTDPNLQPGQQVPLPFKENESCLTQE